MEATSAGRRASNDRAANPKAVHSVLIHDIQAPIRDEPMTERYLIFGDLHGRILPAFRLAIAWAREHGGPATALLQVGDLGYFPDLSRLDKATLKHAKDDPTELGAQDIIHPNKLADAIFDDPWCPSGLWFTAGNHEDFDALLSYASAAGKSTDFPVDYYRKVHCIRDGSSTTLPGGLPVAALWGVDNEGLFARKKLPAAGYISRRSAHQLIGEPFTVLLTHDAPLDAVYPGSGSEAVRELLHLNGTPFSFFGHYRGSRGQAPGFTGTSAVYHMAGMELSGRDGCAEAGSVGVLTWDGDRAEFEYLDPRWLASFTRHNWKWR